MNIAVIGLRGIPDVQGGIEKHCENLYPYIAKRIGDVTLLGRKKYIKPRPYTFKGVKVFPIWSPRSKNLETMAYTGLSCLWLIKNHKRFDMIHIHAIGPSLFAPVLRLWGFTIVVTNHGPEYNRQKWGQLAKWVLKISEYVGCKSAHRIIAVSQPIKNQLRRLYGVEAFYIPNGFVQIDQIPAGETLRRYDLKPKQYVLGVGRLVLEKGFHDLVSAFKRIRTGWKLVIVGAADHEDGYSHHLKTLASNAGRVVMPGFLKGTDLDEIYSNAGIFVLPSYHEGLPITVLEAMGYGLPVILSDIPANKELALPDELFPAGNVKTLAKMIDKHIAMPASADDNRAYKERNQRLSAEFSWARIARQTAAVYNDLISQCSKSKPQ